MSFGKFLSNATKAVGQTSHSIENQAKREANKYRTLAEHEANKAAQAGLHAAKSAGSHLAVAAGKGLQSATKGVGSVGIGKFNVANIANTAAHTGIDGVSLNSASHAVKDGISKISAVPILGPVLGVVTPLHIVDAINNTTQGQRIDRAGIQALNKTVKDYKDVAPYVSSIIAFVPGVGPGVASGIAAGVALSEGKRWSDIAIEAAKGAIPGGAIAQAAFNIAQSAAKGQPLDQMAIAALPVSDQAKQGIRMGLAITKDLASGKRLDHALLAHVGDAIKIGGGNQVGAAIAQDLASGKRIDHVLLSHVDDAMKLAGPEIGKALNIGSAIGAARKIQDNIMKQAANPLAHGVLENLGNEVISKVPALAEGHNLSQNPLYKQGFAVATGVMNGKKASESLLLGLRNALPPEAKKGFDTATSYHIGKHAVSQKPKAVKTTGVKATPAQSFGYFTTHGLAGADDKQKAALVAHIIQHPEMRNGASDAIKSVVTMRRVPSWWDNLKHLVTGVPPQ